MPIEHFLAHRNLDMSYADLSKWASVGLSPDGEDIANTERFIKLDRALHVYCGGRVSIATVATDVGLDPSTVETAFDRCFRKDKFGRLVGRAGLIKHLHLEGYHRTTDAETNFAGIFEKVLRDNNLYDDMVNVVRGKHEDFGPIRRIIDFHSAFTTLLAAKGARKDRYPYTVENLGMEGLRMFVRRIQAENPIRTANLIYGSAAARKIGRAMKSADEYRRFLEPFEAVEIDAHRVDGLIVLLLPGVDGVPVAVVLERLWLIVVLEVKSTAALGFSFAFGRNPDQDDVTEALTNAIIPQAPISMSLTGRAVSNRGGFPAAVLDDCAYRLFGEVRMDNAWSHWTRAIHDELCFKCGAVVNIGAGRQPDDRPNVENFFSTYEDQVLHRISVTTGNRPGDPRGENAAQAAVRYEFSYADLFEMTGVWMAEKNGRAPPGAPRASPLIQLQNAIRVSDMLPRRVPIKERQNWALKDDWETCEVKGGGRERRAPYINYKKVRYSSDRLKRNWQLLKEDIRIKVYHPDLQYVESYTMDGAYFDKLVVEKRWRVPHSFWLRKLYNKLQKANELAPREDPVLEVYAALKKRAKENKKAANELLKLLQQNPELLDGQPPFIGGSAETDQKPVSQPKDERLKTVKVPQQAVY